jgi:hypothetical protein
MNQFNVGVDIHKLVDEMDPGAERAVLRVLGFHIGRENAVGREALVMAVHKLGFPVHERVVRACINQLRKDGNMICSTGGFDGGYWIARDWEELNEYLDRELRSRVKDLAEQMRALEQEGNRKWGPYSMQGKLF